MSLGHDNKRERLCPVLRAGEIRQFLGDYSLKQIDGLTDYVKQFGAKGLAYIALTSKGEERSPISKFLSDETVATIKERLAAEQGDLLLFVADQSDVVFDTLGRLRVHLADEIGLRDPDSLAFCWVIDFPFAFWNPSLSNN